MKNKSGLTKTAGILQIFILIAGVVAMNWLIGASFREGIFGEKIIGKRAGKFLGEEVVWSVGGKIDVFKKL